MKVILDIPDNDAVFAMKVLNSLAFVKHAKPFSKSAAHLLTDLKDAAKEVRLHKQGKIALKSIDELIHEL